MLEVESGRRWSEVRAAPLDHALVTIDADVPPRPRTLLDELPGEAPASAAEIEDGVIGVWREIGEHRLTARIVEELGLGWTH
jgi:hypothetical protein